MILDSIGGIEQFQSGPQSEQPSNDNDSQQKTDLATTTVVSQPEKLMMYDDFSESDKQIRLLEIMPGTADEEIICKLHTVMLSEKPPYEVRIEIESSLHDMSS